MEELMGAMKELLPIVTILGFGVTIFLLGWRIPSRAEMNRIADNLQRQIDKESSSRQEQIGSVTTNLQKQIENETSILQKQIESGTSILQKQIENETSNLQKQIENETSGRQEQIGSVTTNLQKQIENETSNLQQQIDKVFTTSLAITNEIREDMRLMQSQMVRLGEKIDANTEAIHANAQATHADISKLTAKIEIVSHALQAEVGNRDNQESPPQS